MNKSIEPSDNIILLRKLVEIESVWWINCCLYIYIYLHAIPSIVVQNINKFTFYESCRWFVWRMKYQS